MTKGNNQYNVVWAIVDSVRHYHTEGDDRTRLKFMDEFANESIEFTHVITSAPSTVMSISAMMTSLPSFYLGRNYSDFRFDNNYFTTLSSILNSEGYETRALLMHPDIRDKLRVFDLISSKYWPKGFSHKNWWDNKKINSLLKNSLRIDGKNSPKPCFWFLDFNCREDPDTSDIVQDSFNALIEAGYTKENTIFILCSDHGYPDPKRGITPELLKEKNMSHDVFMTEDNIRIPLFISYPGCDEGKKVNEIISTLDLKPTILDLLGIDVTEDITSKWHGKSLVNLINQEDPNYDLERLIRVDARFFGQPGRVSALSGRDYKYVFHHDSQEEEFIDLSNYLEDEKNVINECVNDSELEFKLNHFRQSFLQTEEAGVNFQISYAVNKLTSAFKTVSKSKPTFLIISYLPISLLDSIAKAVQEIIPDVELIVSCPLDDQSIENPTYQLKPFKVTDELISFVDKEVNSINVDFCINVSDHSSEEKDLLLQKFIKTIKPRKSVTMDLNMTLSINKGQISRYLKTLYHKKDFFLEEPSLILFEMKKIFRVLFNRTIKPLIKNGK
jgi:hypothetical protein|tara:strand:+ start:2791 stop:4461 length:1671 start_codon:yes stop_codon:yes gene_type:complete